MSSNVQRLQGKEGAVKAAKRWHAPSASALLRTFVALVLCTGLMIPTSLTSSHAAYADSASGETTSGELRHGTVSVSSEQASGDIITLKVGQTATVSVSPYAHMQYKGCGKSGCPGSCESLHEMDCFVPGMGCKCDHNPVERTADVTVDVADTSVVAAGEVVAGEWNNSDNMDLHDSAKPVTKDAAITLTATKAGTTTVTVSAQTDENGDANAESGNTSTLLNLWHPATKTYTINVTDDAAPSEQPSFDDLESEHNYADNADQTWTYTWDAAAQYGMALTFDEQTETESNYDFITIMDGDDNVLGTYSGKELSGKTVYVPQSATAKIKLTSNQSGNKWGFKVANVTKLSSNDLSLIAMIDPISPQFLANGATPEPVVHYGAKVLTKGTDYTVSYEGNGAVGDAKVVVTGAGIYTGKVERAFKVVDENNLADGAAIKADQTVVLRQSGDKGSTNVSFAGMNEEWANAVTGVTVKAVSGSDAGAEQTLTADQYKVNVNYGNVSFSRTEAAPVFSVAVGEGEPVTVHGRWGDTTYPQSKQYQITVKAAGYKDVVGTVTFCTGASDTFSIIVDADGNDKTTEDQSVVKTFTKDEIESMSTFQNGSSQCGMTGFRTFSAKGVALSDLIAQAGITVSDTDSFKLDTTDDFGRTWTYSQLFGDRYFLQSIYDDQEVKDTYAELVRSDDEAGATVQLRKLLAAKALEDNSIAKPMMSANYVETLISGDEVATAVLPTAENTQVNQLVGQENQYRFTYGISLVKEDHTVTFNTNGGSDVAAQTVQSNLMTSTENTTIRSTYWNNALVIYRGAAKAPEADTNPEQLTVPENPAREGYTFDGWYTKDGSETGSWGDKFDFTANNGTVDVDTQLYAKWVKDGETATQTGHSASAWREAQYGEPPAGDSGNAGQHVTVRVSFDGPVAISDADALRASLNLSVTGSTGEYAITADGNDLVIDTTLSFALMYGQAAVSAVGDSGRLDGVAVDGKPVVLDPISTLVDTGLAFEPTLVVEGTDTTPASTTFKVTHGANVRSMNHVTWLADGSSILPNTGGATQSTVAHHHAWYQFTAIDSAKQICDNAREVLGNNGYDLTDNGDGTFTLTAQKAKAGEVLSAAPYTDSFFNENGLSLGEDIVNAKMPKPTVNIVNLGMKVDMGDDGYETMSTNMGRNPAGKVDFSLVASDDALAEYQKTHAGASMQDMLQAWIDGITSVTVGGKKLEGKAFDEWKASLNDPSASADALAVYDLAAGAKKATLTLPVVLFDTSVSEQASLPVAITSEGFVDVTGKVTYRNIGSTAVVVRILSEDGSEVQQVRTLTIDQLKNLKVQQHYNTASNCGMAGLRSFSSEGVLLTDVLAAAGVEFGEGMSLKMRVNDYLSSNGNAGTVESGYTSDTYTYESLLGTDRYYYPAMWDNATTYSELGGKTIYQVLSADKNAWKGDSEQARFLAKKLGESKQKVEPILAWSWNEGVVAWGGSNPAAYSGYNSYTSDESFRFLYGLAANEDGSAADDNTTFSNVYAVFGIDVLGGKSVPVPVDPTDTADLTQLNQAIAAASQLNQADYTAESWAAYAAALEAAKAVAAKGDAATQAEVDAAAKALSDAQAALVKAPGKKADDQTGQPSGNTTQQANAAGNGQALATTGDSVPVVPIACVAGGALLLAVAAIARRRSTAAQAGVHVRRR